MSFSSFSYILFFLPLAIAGYAVATRWGGRWPQVWLLAASLTFYAFSKPGNVALLAGSMVFNWAIGRSLNHPNDRTRKLFLRLGLVANILFLFSFKYVNFFLGSLGAFSGWKVSLPDWQMPLGVSFFTLTQVMYLVDTYQGLNQPNSL